MDADGIALMFWVAVGGLAILAAAGGIEWLLSRPSRRWIRRMRQLENARIDWQARVVSSQCFFKQDQ